MTFCRRWRYRNFMEAQYTKTSADLFGNGVFCTVSELFFEGARAKDLDLHRLAKTRAVTAGGKRSILRGRGMEFFESRPYVPFDEMRSIDWKVSARYSKLFTKIFIEERDRPVFCVVDLRPSMYFGSKRCFKSVMAAQLAAQISIAAIHGGDKICGMLFDKNFGEHNKLGHTNQHVARWFGHLARGTKTLMDDERAQFLDWPQMLSRLATKCRPGALVFLISDFLTMDDASSSLLFRIKNKHAQIVALSISDPLEEEMPSVGRVGMSYFDERVVFDSGDKTLKSSYENWWHQLQAENEAKFFKLGIPYLRFKTAEDPHTALRMMLMSGRARA